MTLRRALLALPVLFLAACASPPPPAVLQLTLLGGADQNPGPSGHPQSVAVRLFELRGSEKFARADVFALTEHERQTLGDDDLGSQELVLRPGERRIVTRSLKPGTRFIGVVVLFHDIDRAHWRALAPVAASGPSRRVLEVKDLAATLAPS
jgi:type VI secretion system protein VasD